MKDKTSILDTETPDPRLKRFHKKSRLGCVICKQRSLKVGTQSYSLNENAALTISLSMTRHGLAAKGHIKKIECVYSKPSYSPRESKAAAPGGSSKDSKSTTPYSSPCKCSPWTTSVRNPVGVSDAELAQHYLTHTVRTLSRSSIRESQSDVWRIFIPALALTCPVVRRGMLTLAAIWLHYDFAAAPAASTDSSGHPSKYSEAAEAHGMIFVRESRQKLQDLRGQAELDSSFACSRLLCILGFAFFRTHRGNGVSLADSAAWTWLHLLRG